MITFTKKGGEIVSIDKLIERVLSAIRLKPNGTYTITIAKQQNRRSLNQNALMWMWFNCIADETGETPQRVHDYYCAKFRTETAQIFNQTIKVINGTSKATERELGAFLQAVQADASSELGIVLPVPSDLAFENFADNYKNLTQFSIVDD